MKRGDFLLSWPFLASLGVLLVNDFVLKRWYPGLLSGFASDAAGMVFFPLVLVAAAELLAWLIPSRPYARAWWFFAATAFVVAGFILVKTTGWGEATYEALVSPVDALLGTGLGLRGLGVVQDPADLLALLAAPLPIWVGWRWRGRLPRTPEGVPADGLEPGATR